MRFIHPLPPLTTAPAIAKKPFSEFHATYLGKLVEASAPLRGPAILSVGLMVSKLTDMGGETEGFEAGAYELAVKNISYF